MLLSLLQPIRMAVPHATGLDAAEIVPERWACNDVLSCHLSVGVLDGSISVDNEALCN